MQLNSSLFKSYKFWISSIILVYLLTTVFLLPYLIKSQTITFIKNELNHKATIEKVAFNPFTFNLNMKNFELFDSKDKTLISFDNFRVDFDLLNSIYTQVVQFNVVILQKPLINVKLLKDGKLNLLALVPKKKSTQEKTHKEEISTKTENKKESEIFPINFERIVINNTNISFDDFTLDKPLNINITPFNVKLVNLGTQKEQKASYNLDLKINKHTDFKSKGSIVLNPIKVDGNINLSSLHLADYWPKLSKDFNFDLGDALANLEAQYKLSLQKDDLEFNLEKTKFALSSFALYAKNSKKEVIKLDKLDFDLKQFDLQKQEVQINSILLSNLYTDFVINNDKSNNMSSLFVSKTVAKKKEDELPSKPWAVFIKQADIKDSKIQFTDSSITTTFSTSLNKLNLTVKDIDLKEKSQFSYDFHSKIDKSTKLSALGKLSIKPLAIKSDYTLEKLALNIFQPYLNETLNINLKSADFTTKGSFELKEKTNKIEVKTNSFIENIDVKHKSSKESLIKVAKLNINKLQFSQEKNSIKIDSINLIEPYAKVHIDKNKQTNFVNIVKEQPTPKLEVKEETKEEFTFSLGPIDIQKGSMNFTDLSLPLPFHSFIENLKGNVSELSSFSSKPSEVNLEGVIDEYGLAKINGSLNYKHIEQNTQIDMLFKNLATKNLTPYSSEFIGRKIDGGKLTLDLQYKIVDSKLNANNKIVIHKIQLGDEIKSENSVSVPIDLAIALLEDSEGVIDLSLPITGDINDPNFHVGSIVGQALANLLIKAVASPFTLLGSLLGSDSDDLQFIEFEAGNSTLLPPAKEKLDTLAQAFEKRPNLALTLEKPYNRFIDLEKMKLSRFNTLLNSSIESIKKENKDEEADTYLLALESMYLESSTQEELDILKNSFTKEIKITELPEENIENKSSEEVSIDEKEVKEKVLVKTIFEKVKYLNTIKLGQIKAQEVSEQEMQELANFRALTISSYLVETHAVPKKAIVIKDFKVFINKDETKWIKTQLGIAVKQK